MKKTEKNIIYILSFSAIAALIYYFWKKRKGSGTGTETDGTGTKTDSGIDTKTDSGKGEAVRGEVSAKTVYILILQALRDYDSYCKAKGWKNQFSTDDETAKNILTHFWIETGNFQYLYDNNLGNITAGSWKTKDAYQCSPYIRDIYGHKYMGYVLRGDRGEADGKQEFRKYEKLIDSVVDYLDLVNRAKRYVGIPQLYSKSDTVFIKELGRAGYFSANPNDMYETAKKIKENLKNVI